MLSENQTPNINPDKEKILSKIIGNIGGIAPMAGTAALGVGQMIYGSIARKKADALLPPSENPMERQMLNTIRRRRRALETGTAGSADRAAMRQMAKSYTANAFKAGGQANFGQISALQNQAMQNMQNQYGQQLAQIFEQERAQTNRMAGVSRDLSLLRSNRKSAQAENLMKYGQQNLLAAMGMDRSMGDVDPYATQNTSSGSNPSGSNG